MVLNNQLIAQLSFVENLYTKALNAAKAPSARAGNYKIRGY